MISGKIELTHINHNLPYSHPKQILEDKHLSHQQKVTLLKDLEYDLREISVADEENMLGNITTGSLLEETRKTLLQLEKKHFKDGEKKAPTKQ